MIERWQKTFVAYSLSSSFCEKVSQAKRVIKEALQVSKKPYVAFSGGKDSLCVLHLVLEQNPCIMVFHWDYGRYMPCFLEEEIKEMAGKMGVRNFWVETSDKYKTADKPVWYEEFFGRVTKRLLQEGYDVVFVGLRKEESLKRKRRIKKNLSLTCIKEIWPIADWSWMDVWTYIVSRKLPYLSHYDLYAPIVGWDKVRFSTFFDPEFDKIGASNIDGVLMWRYKNINV